MRTLKKSIWSYMYKVTFALVSVILISITALNIANEQSRAQGTADKIFEQMDKMLEENQKELTRLRQEYAAKCLHNTEAIAYILEKNTGARNDLYELRKIAEFMEVDEIHIIDAAGEIVSGTHPQYYGYSFDSGEQMNYFKPMLKDKSLKMVQDIEPNTAEHKLMQYSAMWNSTGEFIVEAGIEPVIFTPKNPCKIRLFGAFALITFANFFTYFGVFLLKSYHASHLLCLQIWYVT